MKSETWGMVLAVLLALPAPAGAASASTRDFTVTRELHPPAGPAAGAAASVEIDAALHARAGADLRALRIFDQAGRETPFCIQPRAAVETVTLTNAYAARIVSFAHLPGNLAELMLASNPTQPPPSALVLRTPLRNFEKQAAVLSGMDTNHWEELVAGSPVFDYSRYVDVRCTTIEVPPRDARYYKLRLTGMTENKASPLVAIMRASQPGAPPLEAELAAFRREPFRLDGVDLIHRRRELVRGGYTTRLTMPAGWRLDAAAPDKQTRLIIDAGNLPVTGLAVETADENFFRAVAVECADDTPAHAWRRIASGTISRVRFGAVRDEKLLLELPREYRAAWYRLTLDNRDNPPPVIEGVRLRTRVYDLVFFPKPGNAYSVHAGGWSGAAPEYDVSAVLARAPAADVAWRMGAEQPNLAFRRTFGLAAGDRWLMLGAIVVMVLALGWLVHRTAGAMGQ